VGVVDRRVDPARCDRVAADALLRVVEGDPLAEHDDRAFRGRVDRQEGLGDEAVDGAGVDQRAATTAEHVRDRVAAAVDTALDVDVERPVDDLVRDLVEDARDVDAGIVEYDVEAAPTLDGGVRVGLDLARVRDVRRNGDGRVPDAGRRLLDRVPADVDAGHPGALLGEPDRRGPADPRARAGHDRHLAGQSIAHPPPPDAGA
jgi:hypothetical protein